MVTRYSQSCGRASEAACLTAVIALGLPSKQTNQRFAGPQDWLYLVTISTKPVREMKEIWMNADSLIAQAEAIINQHASPPRFKSFIRVNPDPRDEILEFAAKNDCDYIVMGSRGRSGLKSIWLGSVSDYVVRKASVPVLVVHERAGKEGRTSSEETRNGTGK